ncbi:hypothetical protein [Streptomyces sp. NPDC006510]|uniref:hypothetical protein n=1 Tax=Streptomyces sp. NPDC006510 TaxID=3155600 RepID=UPI0033A7B39F
MTPAAELQADGTQFELLTGPLTGIYDSNGMGAIVFAELAVAGRIERNHIREKTLEGQRTPETLPRGCPRDRTRRRTTSSSVPPAGSACCGAGRRGVDVTRLRPCTWPGSARPSCCDRPEHPAARLPPRNERLLQPAAN